MIDPEPIARMKRMEESQEFSLNNELKHHYSPNKVLALSHNNISLRNLSSNRDRTFNNTSHKPQDSSQYKSTIISSKNPEKNSKHNRTSFVSNTFRNFNDKPKIFIEQLQSTTAPVTPAINKNISDFGLNNPKFNLIKKIEDRIGKESEAKMEKENEGYQNAKNNFAFNQMTYKNGSNFKDKNLSKSPNSLNLSLPVEGNRISYVNDQFIKSIEHLKDDKRKSVPNSKNLFCKTQCDAMVIDNNGVTKTYESNNSKDAKMSNGQNTFTKSQDRMINPVQNKKSSPGILLKKMKNKSNAFNSDNLFSTQELNKVNNYPKTMFQKLGQNEKKSSCTNQLVKNQKKSVENMSNDYNVKATNLRSNLKGLSTGMSQLSFNPRRGVNNSQNKEVAANAQFIQENKTVSTQANDANSKSSEWELDKELLSRLDQYLILKMTKKPQEYFAVMKHEEILKEIQFAYQEREKLLSLTKKYTEYIESLKISARVKEKKASNVNKNSWNNLIEIDFMNIESTPEKIFRNSNITKKFEINQMHYQDQSHSVERSRCSSGKKNKKCVIVSPRIGTPKKKISNINILNQLQLETTGDNFGSSQKNSKSYIQPAIKNAPDYHSIPYGSTQNLLLESNINKSNTLEEVLSNNSRSTETKPSHQVYRKNERNKLLTNNDKFYVDLKTIEVENKRQEKNIFKQGLTIKNKFMTYDKDIFKNILKTDGVINHSNKNFVRKSFDFQKINSKNFINERIGGRIKSIEKLKQKFMDVNKKEAHELGSGSFDLFQKSKSLNYFSSQKNVSKEGEEAKSSKKSENKEKLIKEENYMSSSCDFGKSEVKKNGSNKNQVIINNARIATRLTNNWNFLSETFSIPNHQYESNYQRDKESPKTKLKELFRQPNEKN